MHEIQNMLVFMKISCQKLVFPRDNVPASQGKIQACQIIKTNLRDNNKFTFTIWLSLIQDRCSFKIGLHNIKEDTSLIVTKNLCQTNEAIYGSVSCLICNMKCKLDWQATLSDVFSPAYALFQTWIVLYPGYHLCGTLAV